MDKDSLGGFLRLSTVRTTVLYKPVWAVLRVYKKFIVTILINNILINILKEERVKPIEPDDENKEGEQAEL